MSDPQCESAAHGGCGNPFERALLVFLPLFLLSGLALLCASFGGMSDTDLVGAGVTIALGAITFISALLTIGYEFGSKP